MDPHLQLLPTKNKATGVCVHLTVHHPQEPCPHLQSLPPTVLPTGCSALSPLPLWLCDLCSRTRTGGGHTTGLFPQAAPSAAVSPARRSPLPLCGSLGPQPAQHALAHCLTTWYPVLSVSPNSSRGSFRPGHTLLCPPGPVPAPPTRAPLSCSQRQPHTVLDTLTQHHKWLLTTHMSACTVGQGLGGDTMRAGLHVLMSEGFAPSSNLTSLCLVF